jgi:CRISPR-associated endonuclease/helicase Cas3
VGQARTNLLVLADGYCRHNGSGGKWETDVRMPTRLGDDYVTFRIAREENGALLPWVSGEKDRDRAWALSEIVLRRSLATDGAPHTGAASSALLALRGDWRQWERDIPVLILRPDGADVWVAEARCREAEVRLGYHPERGLWRG